MNSQNDAVTEHSRFPSTFNIGHAGPPDVRPLVETFNAVGLFTHGCTCVSDGLGELPECNARNCKRKRACISGGCETFSQKRVRHHMDIDARPSGSGTHGHLSHHVQQVTTFSATSTRLPGDAHVSAAPVPHGNTDVGGSSVILDFGAGIIRHEVYADLKGYEFANETVSRVRDTRPCPLDEGLSQCLRVRPKNISAMRHVSQIPRTADAVPSAESNNRLPVTPHVVGAQGVNASSTETFMSPVSSEYRSTSNASTSSHMPRGATHRSQTSSTAFERAGAPDEYIRFGNCSSICSNCHALFWYEERLSWSTRRSGPLYHRCCLGGKVRLLLPRDYPPYIQQLFADPHFLNNIRGYNKMFSMTSLGAAIDESVNVGRGPYVFKVSGQIYHRIGRFCPLSGEPPRFLQLYIFDTRNEVTHRLANFNNNATNVFRPEIVQGLIEVLDAHNALVQLLRTARDKLLEADVPDFKIRLFSVVGSSQHELPTVDEVGAIVFDSGSESVTDFDVVIQRHSGEPECINKLHPAYMSLHFPLLFVFGEQGYHTDLKLVNVPGEHSEGNKYIKETWNFQPTKAWQHPLARTMDSNSVTKEKPYWWRKKWYQEFMGPLLPLPLTATEIPEDEAEQAQTQMRIRDLQAIKPETNALRPFVIEAAITKIDETQGWYFNRCRTCHLKINEGWPHPHCQQPGIPMAPNYTYNFKATLADVTGSIVVTCFSPEANSLLLPVTDLLSYVPDPDPYTLPEIIRDLEHTKKVFTIHIAPGSRRGNTKYILEHAVDAPQPALPDIPPPVQQIHSTTSITEQLPENQTPETPTPQPDEQEVIAVTEMATTEITPPPGTDESIERSERHVQEPSQSVHRQLFPQVSEEDVIQNVPPEVIPTQEIQETLPINIHPPITETVETASVEEHAPLELAPVAEPIQQMEEATPVTAQPTTTDPMQTTTIEEHEPLQPILAQQPPHEPESSHATKKPKHN
ncbi:hypothetical protein CTI12_AA026780 [Artemisia annua]|uniref:Helitron helicase-like domain-containing protein n=1 Tax=Artemisia annua TaxID=35608 RepID=A0A2U1QIB3_ARTAN|nr:hypothetical protein CTI12_AA026780 [Artemisia annua]